VSLTEAAHALGIESAPARRPAGGARFPVAVLDGSQVPVSEVSALCRVLRRAQHPAAWRSTSTSMRQG
jgi:hypothetical protein